MGLKCAGLIAMRVFLSFCLALAAATLLGGYFGWLHPAGDSLSVLRIPAAIGVLVFAMALLRFWRFPVPAVLFSAIALASSAMHFVDFSSGQSSGDLRLYSKNLNAGNQTWQAVADDILASDVDVVTLQEISVWNHGILNRLRPDFPHQHVCPFSDWSGMAVLSRYPGTGQSYCSDHRSFAAMQIDFSGTEVWTASVHLPWPWPHAQSEVLAQSLAALSAMAQPVVLAGDFNMMPWGASVAAIGAATGTERLAGPYMTWRLWNVPLSLDHVLGPTARGQVETRPQMGSDHFGLVAEIAL